MKPLLFPLYAPQTLLNSLQTHAAMELGHFTLRSFPDQETYFKFDADVSNREILFLATLDRPNEKFLPLAFAAQTAKALGAKKCGLIAPYLAYMRQDQAFQPGEAITSNHFAKLISSCFDWMLTVDPHLHRLSSLDQIYTLPTTLLHATRPMAQWIQQNITSPLIIGPDMESKQWADEIARLANAPVVILEKIRKGDREVAISLPQLAQFKHHTPVLIDDIVSTGQTLIQTAKALQKLNMPPPVCIAVHAVFVPNAYEEIVKSGVARMITCNTIEHPSNAIDLGMLIAQGLDNFAPHSPPFFDGSQK